MKHDREIHAKYCIKIAPKWNRLVLFWSDKRNLHQVNKTNVNRYAVSVWYLNVKQTLKAQQND